MPTSGRARRFGRWLTVAVAAAILAGPGAGVLLRAEVGLIRAYQHRVSPWTSRLITCRFDPSCSHFGLLALDESGLWKGNARIAGRLLHCSPFGFVWDYLSGTEH